MQFCLLQKENNFLETEINQKQKTIKKLLDINWLQSKDLYKVNNNSKADKKNIEVPQFQNPNPSRNVYDGNMKQSHTSGKPENNNLKKQI